MRGRGETEMERGCSSKIERERGDRGGQGAVTRRMEVTDRQLETSQMG